MMQSELEKLLKHFQNMYLAHRNGTCDFYEGCLFCLWDSDATEPADAFGRATECLNCGGFYTNDTSICPQCNNIATPGN